MRPFHAFTLALFAAAASALPQPQGDVSAADVLASAQSAARYGSSSGAVDQGLLDELFGDEQEQLDSNYVPPNKEKQKVDNQYDQCGHEVYAKQGFQCVPYYNCDELGEIIIDGGEGLIDIRGNFGQSSGVQLDPENSKCPGDLEVCCRHPDFTDAVTAPPTPKPTTRPPPPKYVSQCGRRNVNGVGVRIQNYAQDASTQFGEWPHMCALLAERDGKNLFVCGASLIGADSVLTAAHCIKDYRPEELKVRCGEWDTQQRVEPKRHQDRYVSQLLKHPGFNSGRLYHDFALLKTSQPFRLDEHVDIICLPDLDRNHKYDVKDCVATGWGKDRFDPSGEYQVILKQVQMDVTTNQYCQDKLRTTKLGRNFRLHDSFICAGGEANVDTCKGDGGGPLVCPVYDGNSNTPRYVQAGIVAWGIGCGENGVPGVYADVTDAMCFIDWAAGCMHGREACPHPKCEGWLQDMRSDLEDKYYKAKERFDSYPGQVGDRGYKVLEKRYKGPEEALKYFDSVTDQCDVYATPYATKAAAYTDQLCFDRDDYTDDLYDDQDDVDVSGYERTGVQNVDVRSEDADGGEDFSKKKAESEEAAAATGQ